jgi:hypothetical protein
VVPAAATAELTITTEETEMTESTTMRAVDRYVAFWNTANAALQQRAARAAFADGVVSHVPLGVMRGPEELIGFRNEFAARMPDYRFQPRAEPDVHHDRARLQWELVVGGESFAAGTDVLELDDTGRIVSIAGFLDRAPEGFDPDAHH